MSRKHCHLAERNPNLSWIWRFSFFSWKQCCTVEQSEIPKQNNKKKERKKQNKNQVKLDKGLKINLDVVTTLGAHCARYKIKVLLFSAGIACFSSMNKFQRSDPKLDRQQSWGRFMQQFCWIQTDLCLWMALADNYILWTAVVDSLVLLLAVETSDCLCELQLLTAWCCYWQWKPVTVSVNCSYWQLVLLLAVETSDCMSLNCSCWQLGAVTCSGNQWLSLWTAAVDSLVLLLAVETSDCLCELQMLTTWCYYWQW